MPSLQDLDAVRADLASLISHRNTGLVIGSGASISSGAPSTSDLITQIQGRFPLAKVENPSNLFDLGTAVADHPSYGRLDLLNFVRDQFSQLEPSDSYRQIPRLVWRAIFTTNYDDLVEKAYRTPSRSTSLQAFTMETASQAVSRPDHILLLYLMGSVRANPENPDAPVISHADFLYSVQKRAFMLKMFRNIVVDGGKFIYLGYSFDDMVLFSVLDEASRILGQRNIPYGYAIFKDPPTDSVAIHRLTSRKIIPINGSFEDFSTLIKEIADGTFTDTRTHPHTRATPFSGATFFVGDNTVKLSAADISVVREAFDIIDNNAIREASAAADSEDDKTLARKFLTGDHLGWQPYVRDWVFVRPWLRELLDDVKNILATTHPGQGEIVLVHGPAGLGKSVGVRKLAMEIYRDTNTPVLVARPSWRARPDVKIITRFVADIEAGMEDDGRMTPILLVIDEAELMDRTLPFRILRYLTSRGIGVVIVLAARTNQYFKTQDKGTTSAESSGIRNVSVPDRLDKSEIGDLIGHLNTMGIWDKPAITTESFWIHQVEHNLGSAFFDTLYELVVPVRTTLEDRVWSEYQQLNEVAQRAYKLIASTHQFGLPLKMEVLMRALNEPFNTFDSEIIRSEARDILFTEHQSSTLSMFFRGRTRTISEIIFRKAVPDNSGQLEMFKEIARNTSPSEIFGTEELDTLRTLLVQVFGPKGYDNRFNSDQLAQIFAVAVEGIDDDVLEHHFGLVERDSGRLLSAKEHLERSLQLAAVLPDDLAVHREAIQNIQNSLAVVLGELAVEAITRNDRDGAETFFEDARRYFLAARQGQFPNAHAYHAHANMLRSRAQRLFRDRSEEKVLGLGEALGILEEGIDNSNADDRPALVEMQGNLLEELGFEEDAIEIILERTTKGSESQRAQYHVILARLFLTSEKQIKRQRLQKGHGHAVRATELSPQLFDAWKLRAEAYHKLQPKDFLGLMEFLEKALEVAEGRENLWVLYNLGVSAFYAGRHSVAATTFRTLTRASRGHHSRTGVEEYAGERSDGGRFKYRGKIVRFQNRMMIEVADLPEYRYIWFNPRTQQYYTPRLGDEVEFSIGFNYRGLLANDLRRV